MTDNKKKYEEKLHSELVEWQARTAQLRAGAEVRAEIQGPAANV